MGPVAWLTHARKTLFTREETFNIHKMFGFPCLVHFIYRFTVLVAAAYYPAQPFTA